MAATVVVFPVPGPPAMTENERRTAVSAARRWWSGPASVSLGGNRRRRPSARRAVVEGVDRMVGASDQIGDDRALVAPVAVEVHAACR